MKYEMKNCFWMWQQIKAKMIQLDRWNELKRSLDKLPNMPGENGTWAEDNLNAVRKRVDLERGGILDDILWLLEMQDWMSTQIMGMKDIRMQLVMEKRYLCSEEWETIAEDLKCSVDQVKLIHDKAMRKIRKHEQKHVG